jgi:DNA repair exonuclease SbcCD nuclease subunit
LIICDGKIKLIGDVHAGREFVRNVPLHRRGEREKLVWRDFEAQLDPAGCPIVIQLGDLFDSAHVSFETIVRAARLYRAAALHNPGTRFYVLAGNHDLSRDLEAVSAFEIFEMLVGSIDTIDVVKSEPVRIRVDADAQAFLFGWNPVVSAAEYVAALSGYEARARYAFGHWDVDARSDPFNLIPTKELAALGVTHAYTGHDHTPRQFSRDGVEVILPGSLQPYSHGEDPCGYFYVTVSLEEVTQRPELFKDKCVRIRLKPGEVFDLQLDCLQLQVERATGGAEDSEIDVSLGDFDLHKIFEDTIEEFKLPGVVAEPLRDKWKKAFASEG